ncbi:unnamed protein product, partial [Tetraodon nigroviridis]
RGSKPRAESLLSPLLSPQESDKLEEMLGRRNRRCCRLHNAAAAFDSGSSEPVFQTNLPSASAFDGLGGGAAVHGFASQSLLVEPAAHRGGVFRQGQSPALLLHTDVRPEGREAGLGAGALRPAALLLAEAVLSHLFCRRELTPSLPEKRFRLVCNPARSSAAGLSGGTELCCAAGSRNLPKCRWGKNQPKAHPARSVGSSPRLEETAPPAARWVLPHGHGGHPEPRHPVFPLPFHAFTHHAFSAEQQRKEGQEKQEEGLQAVQSGHRSPQWIQVSPGALYFWHRAVNLVFLKHLFFKFPDTSLMWALTPTTWTLTCATCCPRPGSAKLI